MIASRRSFLIGATALLAAPAIVRVASLMPIFAPKETWDDSELIRFVTIDPASPRGDMMGWAVWWQDSNGFLRIYDHGVAA